MNGWKCRRLLLVALLIGTVACGDDQTTTAPSPTSPTLATETFTGVLAVNGGVTHLFVSQTSGTVTAVITTIEPDTATIGLSLGTWNGAACQIVLARDEATQGVSLVGSVSASGNLCVRVYDAAGALAEPVNYVIDVTHP